MPLDNESGMVKYSGTAACGDSTYRITVIARSGSWKDDAMHAVQKAGGRYVTLYEEPGATSDESLPRGAAYSVTFISDGALTMKTAGKKPETVLLRGDFSIYHDGDLQKSSGNFRGPTAWSHVIHCGAQQLRR